MPGFLARDFYGFYGLALVLTQAASSPLPLAGEHRPPSAAVLKNAEAALRLWRSLERGGWGELYPLGQRVSRRHPHPNPPSASSARRDPRKRERERTSVVATCSV